MTAKDKPTSEPAAGRAKAECDAPTSTEIQKVAAQFRALSNWLLCGSRNTSFHVGNDMDFAYRNVELSDHRRPCPLFDADDPAFGLSFRSHRDCDSIAVHGRSGFGRGDEYVSSESRDAFI